MAKLNVKDKEITVLSVDEKEADVLNIALFGSTAKQWREANPGLKETSVIMLQLNNWYA